MSEAIDILLALRVRALVHKFWAAVRGPSGERS